MSDENAPVFLDRLDIYQVCEDIIFIRELIIIKSFIVSAVNYINIIVTELFNYFNQTFINCLTDCVEYLAPWIQDFLKYDKFFKLRLFSSSFR